MQNNFEDLKLQNDIIQLETKPNDLIREKFAEYELYLKDQNTASVHWTVQSQQPYLLTISVSCCITNLTFAKPLDHITTIKLIPLSYSGGQAQTHS